MPRTNTPGNQPVTPREIRLTILPQDPGVVDPATGRLLRAVVTVPQDVVLPGPRSSRFLVVDYDGSENHLYPRSTIRPAARPDDDRFRGIADGKLAGDRAFRNQNVYAVAARTLAAFEEALGRRLPWSFSGHQLYLVPAAFHEANAYYDPDSDAILFGAFEGPMGRGRAAATGMIYTCLSHDVVAHETTHAILDGLRSRYLEPGLPDQLAFHEAFADIVALLSAFSIRSLVEHALGTVDRHGRIPAKSVSVPVLRDSVLLGFADEMGRATQAHTGTALRRSVARTPTTTWRTEPGYDEPHLRGEILVAAVMQAFLSIWTARLDELVGLDGGLSRRRAAEEGSKSAAHLLRMVIRAIDYCPPLEFEFEDFVEALITSDQEAAPTDAHQYRPTLVDAFKAFDIESRHRVTDLAALGTLDYGGLNAAELRNRDDELFRFLWLNAADVGLDPDYYASVDALRPSFRVSPEGFLLQEVVATYRQMLNGSAAELQALSLRMTGRKMPLPDGLDANTQVQIHGGAAIIFDQFGRAKHQLSKPIFDWDRQARRLDYLVRNHLTDTKGQYGASLGIAEGQRFAVLHASGGDPVERW
jgi:hypothetical protein